MEGVLRNSDIRSGAARGGTLPLLHAQSIDRATPALVSAQQIRRDVRRPLLPRSVRFALVRRPYLGAQPPLTFATLSGLVASLHQARGTAGIELQDSFLQLQDEADKRAGVAVWRLGEDGSRTHSLGFAWLDGGGRLALQAALFAARPIAAIPEAA